LNAKPVLGTNESKCSRKCQNITVTPAKPEASETWLQVIEVAPWYYSARLRSCPLILDATNAILGSLAEFYGYAMDKSGRYMHSKAYLLPLEMKHEFRSARIVSNQARVEGIKTVMAWYVCMLKAVLIIY
jgi:hypothetical protein